MIANIPNTTRQTVETMINWLFSVLIHCYRIPGQNKAPRVEAVTAQAQGKIKIFIVPTGHSNGSFWL